MKFCPERLIQVRNELNINKAEAARRLNISAMAYGRYEKGEREPSYQSVCHIAQTFSCNIDFLYGNSDEMKADYIMVSSKDSELYSLIEIIKNNNNIKKQLLTYAKKLIGDMEQTSEEKNAVNDELKEIHRLVDMVKNSEKTGVKLMQKWEELAYAREDGWNEGKVEEKIDLVCKKLMKGKSVEQIADDLEDTVENITRICEVANGFAPDYDIAKIRMELQKN